MLAEYIGERDREVFVIALLTIRHRLIGAHTRRLVAAGQLLGIEVLDHVVLGEAGRYVSLKERGIL